MTKTKSSDKAAPAEAESQYTVQELAAAAKQVFHTNPDIVTAALRMAGITKTTQKEAAKIVEAFRKREV